LPSADICDTAYRKSLCGGQATLLTRMEKAICFVVLLQLTACLPIAITISIIRLRDFSCSLKSVAPWLRCDFGRLKRKCSTGEKYSEYEKLVLATRLCAVFLISAGILVCGAKSLAAYRNLSVLAMLPVSLLAHLLKKSQILTASRL
jgi:hypothetical protein